MKGEKQKTNRLKRPERESERASGEVGVGVGGEFRPENICELSSPPRPTIPPPPPTPDSPDPGNTRLCQMLRWGLEKQQRSEGYFYYFFGMGEGEGGGVEGMEGGVGG